MSIRSLSACGVAVCLLALGASRPASADAIPYPGSGSYNPVTYSFTAASTGDVIAYIVGGFGAGYTNEMGLLVNGVLSPAGFGLNNHTSNLGDAFNLGPVNAGDSLVFVLKNYTLGDYAYSDPNMNVAYDNPGAPGHNHIYSTAYTATGPVFGSVPAGTYVAFEDLRFPDSDYNYDDESFVFTNVGTTVVPEPGTLGLLGASLLPALALIRRRR
jgi:hypothetical protein